MLTASWNQAVRVHVDGLDALAVDHHRQPCGGLLRAGGVQHGATAEGNSGGRAGALQKVPASGHGRFLTLFLDFQRAAVSLRRSGLKVNRRTSASRNFRHPASAQGRRRKVFGARARATAVDRRSSRIGRGCFWLLSLAPSQLPLRIGYLDRSLAKPLDDRVVQVALDRQALFDVGHDAAQFEFEGILPEAHAETRPAAATGRPGGECGRSPLGCRGPGPDRSRSRPRP